MPQSTYLKPPTSGAAIATEHDEIVVSDVPIVPFIEGDGGQDCSTRRRYHRQHVTRRFIECTWDPAAPVWEDS
jgi:hypothetical protein